MVISDFVSISPVSFVFVFLFGVTFVNSLSVDSLLSEISSFLPSLSYSSWLSASLISSEFPFFPFSLSFSEVFFFKVLYTFLPSCHFCTDFWDGGRIHGVMIIDWSPVIAYFKAGSLSSLSSKSVEPVCDESNESLAQRIVLQVFIPVIDDDGDDDGDVNDDESNSSRSFT